MIGVVSFFTLLRVLWETWQPDIHRLAELIDIKDFCFGGWLLPKTFIICSNENGRRIMQAKSTLSRTYASFAQAAELKYDFTALADADDPYFTVLHQALVEAMKDDETIVPALVRKHFHVFLSLSDTSLENAFNTFFDAFWCDYLFGGAVNTVEYTALKRRLVSVMHKRFYDRGWKSVLPLWLQRKFFLTAETTHELRKCKQLLRTMIFAGKRCHGGTNFARRFSTALFKHKNCPTDYNGISMRDNIMFDLFFEPDFLSGVVLSILTHQLTNPNAKDNHAQGLKDAFLFPFRGRVLQEDVVLADNTLAPRGSTVFVNLHSAGLYHSTGARTCLGKTFTQIFKREFFGILDNWVNLYSVSCDPQLQQNKNLPTVSHKVVFSWKPRADAFQFSGNAYVDNSSMTMWDTLAIYEDPLAFNIAVEYLLRHLPSNRANLVIVAPETRALSLAGALAARANVPLVTVRKLGGWKMDASKLERESYTKGYNTIKADTLELPTSKADLLRDKIVVLVDDGIASGNSLNACEALVTRLGAAQVECALCLVNHTYATQRNFKQLVVTVFDSPSSPSSPSSLKQ